jgi:PAS domain S-box-containing protein
MTQNINERSKIEEQLRLQSAALGSAANAIVITRKDGTIHWVNPAFEQLTGFTAAEVIGQTPRVLRSGLNNPAFFRDMWNTILAGKVWRGELVNKRKDESLYHEEITITPVTDSSGEISHFIAIKLDITERKRAEEALLEARQNLEQLVAERTAQLVEANSNLQTFAHSAAHDLRSPLRSISSFATLALDEYGSKLEETARLYLDRIRQSADQMERLLNDLLEYSKLSQTEINLQTVSLSSAVHQALALLDADIKAKRPQLVISDSMPTVIAHPATVVLILTNLLSNAMKFVPPDLRPRVEIQAEKMDDFVRLSVADNGIGIDPRAQDKLFQLFQRLNSKHAYEGTGMGLAIVRKAAERMGGSVGMESEPGRGSRFWVDLRPARR